MTRYTERELQDMRDDDRGMYLLGLMVAAAFGAIVTIICFAVARVWWLS